MFKLNNHFLKFFNYKNLISILAILSNDSLIQSSGILREKDQIGY